MKKIFYTFIIFTVLISCKNSHKSENNKSKMKFESELIYDFGVIQEGGDTTTVFIFKNTGSEPLIITNTKTSCGCTVPVYPKEPIKPGNKGELKVKFNRKGREGHFTKSITVYSNAENSPVILKIKGNIDVN